MSVVGAHFNRRPDDDAVALGIIPLPRLLGTRSPPVPLRTPVGVKPVQRTTNRTSYKLCRDLHIILISQPDLFPFAVLAVT